jgi:regulation of enolase protein 1 (concanavalin A-like superfamily)
MHPSSQSDRIVEDRFDQPTLNSRWRWLNRPPSWRVDPSLPGLIVEPSAQTDFWQETHYGFRSDNGHFLFTEIAGDFSITTKLRFVPANQYDQAGLMVRNGPLSWIKTSVEYEPHGPSRLGAVVTNRGFSDWSVQNFMREKSEICLRIRKEGGDFIIEFAFDEHSDWTLMRIAYLEAAAPLACGLYACSPKGAGFKAEFSFVQIDRTAPRIRNNA